MNFKNISKKPNTTLASRRLVLAILTGLVLFFSAPGEAQAQFQTVEDLLSSASVGGTRGYRLRRIGAAPAGSMNTNYVYYPASSIKILQAYFAMAEVDDGSWSLNGTNLDVCNGGSVNCSAVVNGSAAGCNPIVENLGTVITGMMVNSSNVRTNAVQEQAGQDFWPAGAPFNNNRAHYGRVSMTNFAQNDLNMSNTSLNHKFGCSGACEPVPNTLTLTDVDRCYANIAYNTTIMSPANRMELYARVPNNATWMNNMIDEEAADLNKQTHAAAFKAQVYSMNKGGSWQCNGSGYYSNAGLVQLPTYNGAFKRLFVWGTFIDGTDPALYNGNTHAAANRELMRSAIRGALLTWSLPWYPGSELPGITTGASNAQSQLNPSSPEHYFIGLAIGHLQAAGPVIDSTLPIKPPLEELEQASFYLQMANQSLSDPGLDSLVVWITDLGVNMAEDVKAYAVSTGDGPLLERSMNKLDANLQAAKKEQQRGNHTRALLACISVAEVGDPIRDLTLNDSTLGDPNYGF